MLEVRNLTKISKGGVLALDRVSFQVPRGQCLAIIGLSGSGKFTLCHRRGGGHDGLSEFGNAGAICLKERFILWISGSFNV